MKMNLNTLWARVIVEELVRCGVDYFCISPGSRSTPLVAAIARHPRAKAIVSYDERGSGFHAVGVARATGKAAVVVTTSGTAAANVYPAVMEASVDGVPMVVLTADRPPELTDTGANQTMNQAGMFGGAVRWQFDLPCPTMDVGPEVVLTTVDHAVSRACGVDAGPVHINCRYREPLEPVEGDCDEEYTRRIGGWLSGEKAYTTYLRPRAVGDEGAMTGLAEAIDRTERGMLVVGRLGTAGQREAVRRLAEKLGWVVYADVTSGLRWDGKAANVIRYFDQELLSDAFMERVRPDAVVHIGGRITSKRAPLFIDACRPKDYAVIKETPGRYDPIHAVTMHVQSDVEVACESLCEKAAKKNRGEYVLFWERLAEGVSGIIERGIAGEKDISEPFVAAEISGLLPEGSGLFLSSSMPIRDVDLYGGTGRSNVQVGANRGISGIDGVISSAAGFAAGLGRMTTLLVGDIAFIHDVNAMSTLRMIDAPLVIVVVNNHGGGIFDFLPISQHTDIFEEYFAAGHEFSFGGVCETFGVEYHKAQSKGGFTKAYENAVKNGRTCVIEVETEREKNLALRRSMKRDIIEVLNRSA